MHFNSSAYFLTEMGLGRPSPRTRCPGSVCGTAAKVSGSLAHPPGESPTVHPLAAPQLPSATGPGPWHSCPTINANHFRKSRPFVAIGGK